MDKEISQQEVLRALKQMKNKKAADLDCMISEMLKFGQCHLLYSVTKLFNLIFSSGLYPKKWASGYIIPIHKTDSPSNPNNYRGITITSCCGKLFNIVINNRIQEFLSSNFVIDKAQIGFEKGKRTSDHVCLENTN